MGLPLIVLDLTYRSAETRPSSGAFYDDDNGNRSGSAYVFAASEPELLTGLGTYTTNGGWMLILDDHAGGYSELAWARVNWSVYNSANGETWPQVKKGSGTAGSAVSYQFQAQTSMQDGPPF